MRRIPSSVVKLGIFTAVTALVLVLLATLIGNISLSPTSTYTALLTDATALNPGDQVRLAGVEVGSVQSLRLVTTGGHGLAKVAFTVDKSVPVYRSAHIQERYQNLVGGRYLAIVEQPGDAATMPPGGTFGVQQTSPALNLTALFNGFQPLFVALDPQQVNQLSFEIVQTLQGEGGTLQTLMATTAQLTKTVADKDQVVGQVIDNLTAVLQTVDQRNTALTSLIGQFRDLMAGLAANKNTISGTLPDLAALLDSTSGMISDVRAPLRADIGSLRSLTEGLSSTNSTLDKVLREEPGRLNTYTRLGSYGSWFNFYLCGTDVRLTLLGQAMELRTPVGAEANERDTVCAQGPTPGGGSR